MALGLYKVIAEFMDAEGSPLCGDSYSVALLDEDRFFDDKLGEARLNADGAAEFLVSAADCAYRLIVRVDSSGFS